MRKLKYTLQALSFVFILFTATACPNNEVLSIDCIECYYDIDDTSGTPNQEYCKGDEVGSGKSWEQFRDDIDEEFKGYGGDCFGVRGKIQ